MKTLEQIPGYKGGSTCNFLDGRDKSRLLDYLPVSEWGKLGFGPEEGADMSTFSPKEWTLENIRAQLRDDLAFAFEKALNERGISSSLMFDVIKMWMWVLDDELQDFTYCGSYGMPLYVAVAKKYNLPDPTSPIPA